MRIRFMVQDGKYYPKLNKKILLRLGVGMTDLHIYSLIEFNCNFMCVSKK